MILKIHCISGPRKWIFIDDIRKIEMSDVETFLFKKKEDFHSFMENFETAVLYDIPKSESKEYIEAGKYWEWLIGKTYRTAWCQDRITKDFFSVIFMTSAYVCNDNGKTINMYKS